jgi:hypothetical protein
VVEVVAAVEVAAFPPLPMAVEVEVAAFPPLPMAVEVEVAAFPPLPVFLRRPPIFRRRGFRLLSARRLILRQRRGRRTLLHRTRTPAWRRRIDLADQSPHTSQLRSLGIMSARMRTKSL